MEKYPNVLYVQKEEGGNDYYFNAVDVKEDISNGEFAEYKLVKTGKKSTEVTLEFDK